ncbi:MAG: PEP-CTERM sorting domain-containing protein [Coleofasciculus sp. B1-GNL1-01]|uniref:PEP-CTERM sorting domain-containing protein n=1 Tax=Coleofasciculus sp. B1-GNL1-01 TaxID=3068484 RepID=UPI0033044EC4
MKFSSLVPSVVAAAGVVVASSAFSPAQAALTSLGTCSTSNLQGAELCEGAFKDNDSSSLVNDNKLFGIDTWSQLFKVDSSSGVDGGLNVTADTYDEEEEEKEAISGTWSLADVDFNTSNIMVVLKGGPSFSAYKLNGATSGRWNTDGVVNGGDNPGPGLSHVTVYQAPKDIQNAEPVPEPLTILGSATALGIGGLLKRQQSKKNNKA